jgi:hypothetical protein
MIIHAQRVSRNVHHRVPKTVTVVTQLATHLRFRLKILRFGSPLTVVKVGARRKAVVRHRALVLAVVLAVWRPAPSCRHVRCCCRRPVVEVRCRRVTGAGCERRPARLWVPVEARSSGIDAGGSYGHHPALTRAPLRCLAPGFCATTPAAAHPKLASRQMAGYCVRPAQRSATACVPHDSEDDSGVARWV